MRSQGSRLAAGLAAGAAFVALWLYLAPIQLGGSSTYSITAGVSMEPMLYRNDLALVRAQRSYKVGDVVLYHSSVLDESVLHRIIAIQHGHYYFKGDNNNFIDPGYATRSELLGKLWLHMPVVGGVLGWVGKPAHASIFASLTMIVLLFGGATTKRKRKRRRSQSPARAAPAELAPNSPAPMSPAPMSPAPAPKVHAARSPMQMSGRTLSTVVVLLVLGVVGVGVGFGSPTNRFVAQPGAYQDTGTFSYSAHLLKPNATYPTGVAVTGQPLFPDLVDWTNFRFAYRFVSKLPHHVHGTIELKALILSQESGWQNLYKVDAREPFTGDSAETGRTVKLQSLYTLLNQVSTASGVSGSEYSLDLQPVVHIVGTVGGKAINSTFAPVLPFTVTTAALRLNVTPTGPVVGATYKPETPQSALNAAVKPFQSGSIPRLAANPISIARYQVRVLVVRVAGLISLVLAMVAALLLDRILRRGPERSDEERIAAQFGCLVATIDTSVVPEGRVSTPVGDFTSLAKLAQYLERPILRQTDATGSTYAVDDDTRVYQYRAAAATPAPPPSAPSAPRIRLRHVLGGPSR
jgi:signal peptidase I